jgi:hypothetical protein
MINDIIAHCQCILVNEHLHHGGEFYDFGSENASLRGFLISDLKCLWGVEAILDPQYGFLTIFHLESLFSSGEDLLFIAFEFAYIPEGELIFDVSTPITFSVNQAMLGGKLGRELPFAISVVPSLGRVDPVVAVREQELISVI